MERLYKEIERNAELDRKLENRIFAFEKEGCRIHDHAYRNHGMFTVDTTYSRDKKEVSYFHNGTVLAKVVAMVAKHNHIAIKNFMVSRKDSLVLEMEFTKPIGFVINKDDSSKCKTNKARVIMCKDFETGMLITKNAYPIM